MAGVGVLAGRDLAGLLGQPNGVLTAPAAAPPWWQVAGQVAGAYGQQLGQGVANAFTLPGDVYAGRTPMLAGDNPAIIPRATNLAGLLTMGSGAMPAGPNELGMGIRAYHGSPHDFNAFDSSKIGTGEGAQVYGHGLYFAENPQVAQSYKDALKWKGSNWDDPQTIARNSLDNAGGDRAKAAAELESALQSAGRGAKATNPQQKAADAVTAEAARILRSGEDITAQTPVGKTYEVDINAHPDEFLDWDKPLSQQSQKVQEALHVAGVMPRSLDTSTLGKYGEWGQAQAQYLSDLASKPGSAAYTDVGLAHGGYGRDVGIPATEALRAAGVKGIRYADAGSRMTYSVVPKNGEWGLVGTDGNDWLHSFSSKAEAEAQATKLNDFPRTNNYVVFDDKTVQILKKYGLAGLTTAGAGAAVAGQGLKDTTGKPIPAGTQIY